MHTKKKDTTITVCERIVYVLALITWVALIVKAILG